MKSENGLHIYFLSFTVISLFFICLNFSKIVQLIKDFFENRKCKKLAKNLGWVDKGTVPTIDEMEIMPDGSYDSVGYHEIHPFCKKRLRLGILKGESLKWCSTCECITSINSDGSGDDDGNDKEPPDIPPSPDAAKLTGDTIERMKKGLGCS